MESFKNIWLHEKLKTNSSIASCNDCILIILLHWILSTYLLSDSNEFLSLPVLCVGVWIINIFLIMSSCHATIGMRNCSLQFYREDGRPITISQAILVLLLSPLWVSFSLLTLFYSVKMPADLYTIANATILFYGFWGLQVSFYKIKFGNLISARKSLTGLDTIFSPKKLKSLEGKFSKKSERHLKISEKWIRYKKIFSKSTYVLILVCAYYFSSLVIVDLFKKLEFKDNLSTSHVLNWGQDNAFFALEGLNAPTDVTNFYEWGRNTSRQFFARLDHAKKIINSKIALDGQQESASDVPAPSIARLEFIGKGENYDIGELYCLYSMDIPANTKCVAEEKNVVAAIEANKILWDRFNKLPDYKNYQLIPTGLDSNLLSGSLISLVRLKDAQIIIMQQNGHSEEALNEWARYMNFYRLISQSHSTKVSKAIHIIMFRLHARTLKTILYNDPSLAVRHLALIEETLSPKGGVVMFDGQAMNVDDWRMLDTVIQYGMTVNNQVGSSTGIRNKIYQCAVDRDKLALLSAKEYSMTDINKLPCEEWAHSMPATFFEMSFLTTGNPITNNVYGLIASGALKGTELVEIMNAIDAEMRMIILGARILKEHLPADAIEAYVNQAPKELQNPFAEAPFLWNTKDKYLYFIKPSSIGSSISDEVKFKLKM